MTSSALAAMASRWFARRPRWMAALSLFTLCALLRLGLVDRQGLWADELFSLAMATGHSLEHPAAQADPALGDYVELPGPASPAAYSRYLEHDHPPSSPGRVVRAVSLSDTNPPLYYLLVYGWTRFTGTSDVGLRLFSVTWALACFPLLWSLAKRLEGRSAAIAACLLFSLSPRCILYSTEGRMYSLLWFFTLSSMWLTLRLNQRGFGSRRFLTWILASAAGLLTHYFFGFVWVAAVVWLLVYPGKFSRKLVALGAILTTLLVLPWYARLPESLANWRVTSAWLNYPPPHYFPLLKELSLPWSYFSLRVNWDLPLWLDGVNLAVFVALAAAIWWTQSWSLLVSPRYRLLWFWLAGALGGPALFDLLRGTYATAHGRYALAGMPAAFLLAGIGLGRLPPRLRTLFVGAILLFYLAGIGHLYLYDLRNEAQFQRVGRLLAEQAGETDLVIVHSIPSGVAGVARYLEREGTREVGFASWVGQLRQRRVPDDLEHLALGRRRIILVKIHEAGEPAPQEDYLRDHGLLIREYAMVKDGVAYFQVLFFVPRQGETFFETRRPSAPQK